MLEIRDIELELGERKLSYNQKITFPQGTISLIKGESGAGKTTLLYILGMISKQTNYKLFFNKTLINKQIQKENIRKNEVGMLYQNFNLLEDLSLYENLKLFADINSVKITEKKAEKFLQMVNLEMDLKRKFGSLSGGEKQRFSLACVILKNPSIIIADEPTSALDKDNADQLMTLLYTLAKKYNKTIIISTHSKDYDSIADNILTLYRDKISQSNPLETHEDNGKERKNRDLNKAFYLDMSKFRIQRIIKKSGLVMALMILMLSMSVFLYNYSKSTKEEYTHYLNKSLQNEVFMIPTGYDSELTEEEISKLLSIPSIDGIYPIDAVSGEVQGHGYVEVYPVYSFQDRLNSNCCAVDSSLFSYLGETIKVEILGEKLELTVQEIYPLDKTNLYSKESAGKIFIPIEYIEDVYQVSLSKQYVMEISNFFNYDNVVQKTKAITDDYELYSSYHYFVNLLRNAERQQIYVNVSSVVLILISVVLFITVQIHEVKDKRKEMCIFQANGLNKKHVFRLEIIENIFKFILIFVLGIILSYCFVMSANHFVLKDIIMVIDLKYVLAMLGLLVFTIILPGLVAAFYMIRQSPEDELRALF